MLYEKGIEIFTLIEGNICDTIPAYAEANPHLKIALLHIDADVYAPTKCCLEHLYDRVVKGGIIVLDDYGVMNGETKAGDDFIERMNISCRIKKSLYHCIPCYMIKQ